MFSLHSIRKQNQRWRQIDSTDEFEDVTNVLGEKFNSINTHARNEGPFLSN